MDWSSLALAVGKREKIGDEREYKTTLHRLTLSVLAPFDKINSRLLLVFIFITNNNDP